MLYRPEKWSSHKVEKNRHFAKGLVHGFCQKIELFSHMLFLSKKKGRKKHFLIFWIEKNAFQTWKVKFLKSRKNRHFAKGLVHGFSEKIELFLIFSLSGKKARANFFFDILERKECFLDLKISYMFLHVLICSYIFFFSKKSQKETFFDILDRK